MPNQPSFKKVEKWSSYSHFPSPIPGHEQREGWREREEKVGERRAAVLSYQRAGGGGRPGVNGHYLVALEASEKRTVPTASPTPVWVHRKEAPTNSRCDVLFIHRADLSRPARFSGSVHRPSGSRASSSGPPGTGSRTSACRPSRSGRSCPARSHGQGPPPPPSPAVPATPSRAGHSMIAGVRRSRR